MKEKKFELKQVPVIVHKLNDVGKQIDERINRLELDKQVAIEETIQSMKVTRADLNREHKEMKDQLKLVKDAVSKPYIELQESFKANITEKYENADSILKDKISSFELKLKEQKRDNVKKYFNELLAAEKIDFVTFEHLKLNVTLTITEKKLKEQASEFIYKVVDDLELIRSHEFEADIMVEYKEHLNVSKATTTVVKRKEAAKLEEDRIRLQEQTRRKNEFLGLSMTFDSISKSYVYNDEIYISEVKVNEATKEEFNVIIEEYNIKISDFENAKIAAAKPIESKPDQEKPTQQDATEIYRQNELSNLGLKFNGESFIYEDINFHWTDTVTMSGPEFAKALAGAKERMNQLKPVSKPIEKPVEQNNEPIVQSKVLIEATRSVLMELGRHMRSKGINYKNID